MNNPCLSLETFPEATVPQQPVAEKYIPRLLDASAARKINDEWWASSIAAALAVKPAAVNSHSKQTYQRHAARKQVSSCASPKRSHS
jgi:hypothetical protein